MDCFLLKYSTQGIHSGHTNFIRSRSCSDIRNVTYVTCHSDSNKFTAQASLFLCPGSSNRRIGLLGESFCSDPSSRRNIVCQTSYSVDTSTYDGAALESLSHVTEEKVGVLLLNLGGPETLNDVQPFLFNLFADPIGYHSSPKVVSVSPATTGKIDFCAPGS